MSDCHYYDLLSRLVVDSLLHLYLTVSETTRITPIYKRNEILVRFLKLNLKNDKYKHAKIEIKRLLEVGRHKNGNLEDKLLEIYATIINWMKNATDAQKLFDFLERLRSNYKLDTRFIINNEKHKPMFVYILQSHVETCFDNRGVQVAPVSLFFQSQKAIELESICKDINLFDIEVKTINVKKSKCILFYTR